MIKIALIFNINGKSRYIRVYDDSWIKEECIVVNDSNSDTIHSVVIKEIYNKIKGRKVSDWNIIEELDCLKEGHRVIYRKYATLFFVFIVDDGESELAMIDLIQNCVQLLEKNFPDVCEYHLVFNPDMVYSIMDEVIMDGMVTEINIGTIHENIQLLYTK